MKLYICPICGTKVEDDSQGDIYCPNCYQKLSSSKEKVVDNTSLTINSFMYIPSKSDCEMKLNENKLDSNALFSLCLQNYGFSFDSNEIIKCNLINKNSIFENKFYIEAINNADEKLKAEIIEIAQKVDIIQKDYINKIDSIGTYDVFLCFDNSNKGSLEFNIAGKLYNLLVNSGYRTFIEDLKISKENKSIKNITIDKAINDSKCMIILGTSLQAINSDIVTEAYKKFIKTITPENKKEIVTCFKDILSFDYPIDLVNYTTFDLNKPSVKLDLLEYIDDLFDNTINFDSKNYKENPSVLTKQDAVLKRIKLMLEDNNFNQAKKMLSEILLNDPSNYKCYLYLICLNEQIKCIEELVEKNMSSQIDEYLKKAIYYCNDVKEKEKLQKIQKNISYRAEYKKALEYISLGHKSEGLEIINRIIEYPLAKKYLTEYEAQAKKKEEFEYYNGINDEFRYCNQKNNLNEELFNKVVEKYKDSDDERINQILENSIKTFEKNKLEIEQDKIELEKRLQEISDKKAKRKKVAVWSTIISSISVVLIVTIFVLYANVIKPNNAINKAKENIENGQYWNAIEVIKDIDKDEAKTLVRIAEYLKSMSFSYISKTEETVMLLSRIDDVKVSIKYDANGGVCSENSVIVNNFTEFNKNVKREGYVFTEWKLLSYDFDVKSYTLNIELEAQYKEKSCYISYDLNGGTLDNPVTYYDISYKNKLVGTPTKPGYKFVGWSDNKSVKTPTKEYRINYFDLDLVLEAHWEVNTYNITFNSVGGSKFSPMTVEYGQKINLPKPTKNEYTFLCWYYVENGKEIVFDSAIYDISSNITLYAKWTPIQYSIKYELDGGLNNFDNPYYYTIDSTIVLKSPTKEGYKFIGWTYEKQQTPTINLTIDASISKNIVIVAHWEII